eukprot:526523_1
MEQGERVPAAELVQSIEGEKGALEDALRNRRDLDPKTRGELQKALDRTNGRLAKAKDREVAEENKRLGQKIGGPEGSRLTRAAEAELSYLDKMDRGEKTDPQALVRALEEEVAALEDALRNRTDLDPQTRGELQRALEKTAAKLGRAKELGDIEENIRLGNKIGGDEGSRLAGDATTELQEQKKIGDGDQTDLAPLVEGLEGEVKAIEDALRNRRDVDPQTRGELERALGKTERRLAKAKADKTKA